jgi:hypothetical protein
MLAQPRLASGAERFRALYQLLAALSQASTLEDVYNVALTSLLQPPPIGSAGHRGLR